MLAGFYKKKTGFKKRLMKVIKIFLKKRKTKNPQYVCKQYWNLSEEPKKQYDREQYKNNPHNQKQLFYYMEK